MTKARYIQISGGEYVQIDCAECGADLPERTFKLPVESQFGPTEMEFCCVECMAAFAERLEMEVMG